VLSRSQLRQDFPLLTDEKVEQLLELLLLKSKLLHNVPRRFELPRDPNDEPYLNAAIEAGAQFLVSRDRDLLDLMDWNTREGRDFRSRFPQLRILTPVEFLEALETE
jgi:predicted nucleic acid-binding protein